MYSSVKALESVAVNSCSLSISRSPKLRLVFLFLVGGLEHVTFVYVWAPLHLNQNSYVLTVKYLSSILGGFE